MSWSADSAVMLARHFGLYPTRCGTRACGNSGWGEATDDGDPHDCAIFQCRGCGRFVGLGRAGILRRIRALRQLGLAP